MKSLYLDCVSDEIKDVSRLANLSNLEHLTLINTEILNINFLAGFSGLKSLTLCENGQLRDFSVIGDLVNLESLHLDLNDLSGEQPEYQDIGKLKNLKRLQLRQLGQGQPDRAALRWPLTLCVGQLLTTASSVLTERGLRVNRIGLTHSR